MILQSRASVVTSIHRPFWPYVFIARPASGEEERRARKAYPGVPEIGETRRQELCISLRQACRVVLQLTAELLAFTAERAHKRRDTRRQRCHVRQIAMYVCHVQLRIPQPDVAFAFGRDRTTVRHACAMVEDRRDAKGYDEFVSAVERLAVLVFQPAEGGFDD